MRTSLAALAFAATLGSLAIAPAGAQTTSLAAAAATRAAAPLDEYFGPLKMSPLGIRNELASINAHLDVGDVGDQALLLKHVALIERAIHDWEAHYPGDGWLPDAIANLHTVYAKTPGRDAKLLAIDAATWLIARYPASDEAKGMRDDLASAMFEDGDGSTTDPNATPGELASPAAPSGPAAAAAAPAPVAAPIKAQNAWQRFHAQRATVASTH